MMELISDSTTARPSQTPAPARSRDHLRPIRGTTAPLALGTASTQAAWMTFLEAGLDCNQARIAYACANVGSTSSWRCLRSSH